LATVSHAVHAAAYSSFARNPIMKKHLRFLCVAVLLTLGVTAACGAAEWQFSVDLPGTRIHAAMWIPSACPLCVESCSVSR